jgi:hypothetical protein
VKLYAAGLLFGLLVALLMVQPVYSQESDFAVKKSFEERSAAVRARIESATSIEQLDSLKSELDGMEMDFAANAAFLDKALFPETFESKMKDLRDVHARMLEKNRIIQTQTVQIRKMETAVESLTYRLDTLTVERDRLFTELQQNKSNVTALRETVRRLQNSLALKDKLLFTLVDSLFMPYGKDLAQASDIQRDALATKIEKTGVITRVYDIAADNVRFLEATSLQGKDFANLIDHYQQFNSRWRGLSEKMHAVYLSSQEAQQAAAARRGTGKEPAAMTTPPTEQVDSLMAVWNVRLRSAFWNTLEKEFSTKGIVLPPFSDAPGFSTSIRTHVETLKNSGDDPTVFVEEVWKLRIDKEWRDALSRDGMLGKEEYAALDKMVGQLAESKFDMKFVLYVGIIALAALILWWLLARKPKPPAAPAPIEKPPPPKGTRTFGE